MARTTIVVVAGLATWLGGCASQIGEIITPPPIDLACRTDDDCEIVSYDIGRCCAHCPVQPYAISREAVRAHQESCSGVACTMELCQIPGIDRPERFVAVCVDRRCERRTR